MLGLKFLRPRVRHGARSKATSSLISPFTRPSSARRSTAMHVKAPLRPTNWPPKAAIQVATLMVVSLGVATGCSSLYDEATDAAREHMGAYHAETVACLERGLAAQSGVDRARQVIDRCVDTRREDAAAQQTYAGSFQQGSWLLHIENGEQAWTLEVLDVGYASRSRAHSEYHRAVIQCWTTTMDFESSTMTVPSRASCPSDIENAVVGKDALEEKHLVTEAPPQE
jgi:hypothetical protein